MTAGAPTRIEEYDHQLNMQTQPAEHALEQAAPDVPKSPHLVSKPIAIAAHTGTARMKRY